MSVSAPRLSQNAEAARAAAAQAEFNEKKWVWVPDEKDGYLAGWVVSEEDEVGEVMMHSGDVRAPIPFVELFVILNFRKPARYEGYRYMPYRR